MSRYSKARHSKKPKNHFRILSIFFLLLCVSCIIYISYVYAEAERNRNIYYNISNIVDNGIKSNAQKVIDLKKENEDIIGWIKIEDTIIDYPILQTNDNNFYLKHNYKKEKSKYGSIYAKSNCNIKDNNSNIIIYGHNLKDDQMFNCLLKYQKKEFYDTHQQINISTENEENIYTIVSVFKSRVFYQDEKNVFKYYNYTRFDNEEEYNNYIMNCKKIELYNTGVSAQYGEQIITLVTCEYSQVNGRMVVIAKKT